MLLRPSNSKLIKNCHFITKTWMMIMTVVKIIVKVTKEIRWCNHFTARKIKTIKWGAKNLFNRSKWTWISKIVKILSNRTYFMLMIQQGTNYYKNGKASSGMKLKCKITNSLSAKIILIKIINSLHNFNIRFMLKIWMLMKKKTSLFI